MSAGDAKIREGPFEFRSALEKLNRLFADALHRGMFTSCNSAWADIERAGSAKKKIEILNDYFERWRNSSANAVNDWLPKYVELAAAYPEVVADPIQRAKDSVWEMAEAMCGTQRPKSGEPLRANWVVNPIILYWFAVASELNPAVNLPPLRPWTAPNWLASGRRQTSELLEKYVGYLWLRVDSAINNAIALAEVQRASKRNEHITRVAGRLPKHGAVRAAYPRRNARKPGRTPRLDQEFLVFAGTLWRNALANAPTVSDDKLVKIASSLDAATYLPPVIYLEAKYAQELKRFNSRNSNSKNGPVKTWSQLISLDDKDLLRGMRRLLSRCSTKLDGHGLSGN